MNKHAISIKWSDEDNGFIATIPGIQGLSSFGTTREKALAELKIASEAFFESLKKAGKKLPVEEKIITYSGQIRLRMPKSLHAELSDRAREECVSLNTYIITLLSEGHVKNNFHKEISSLRAELEIVYSQLMSNDLKASRNIHKIEERKDKNKAKKSKKG